MRADDGLVLIGWSVWLDDGYAMQALLGMGGGMICDSLIAVG